MAARQLRSYRGLDPLEGVGLLLLGAGAGAWLASRSFPTQGKEEAFGAADSRSETGSLQRARAMERGRGRRARSPLEIPWRGWKDILLRTYRQVNEDRLFAVAAGVVFLGLLALFPALTALVSLYGLFADAATANEHLEQLSGALPPGAFSIIHDQVVRVASKSDGNLTLGFIIGLGVAVWSANAGVKAVIDSLNVVYEQSENRGFFRLNLTTLALTFGAILFVLVALALVVVFPVVMESFGLASQADWMVSLARWPAFIVVMMGGLALLYRFGPDRRDAKLQWITTGGMVASFLWALMSAAFSFYLANFADYDATYGTLGAAIGLMMWMWLTMIIVLVGAELNAEIEHQTAVDTTVGPEKPLGMRGATMADTVGEAAG